MAMKFFENSKILPFYGINSESNQYWLIEINNLLIWCCWSIGRSSVWLKYHQNACFIVKISVTNLTMSQTSLSSYSETKIILGTIKFRRFLIVYHTATVRNCSNNTISVSSPLLLSLLPYFFLFLSVERLINYRLQLLLNLESYLSQKSYYYLRLRQFRTAQMNQ